MGNHQSGSGGSNQEEEFKGSQRSKARKSIVSAHTPALEKLFQKLELTAETDNGHPGEITRTTFENVFHGPFNLFGKMLYRQMSVSGHHNHHGNEKLKDRISCEQFVKGGKEVLTLFDEPSQQKYYFKLFSEGRDQICKEGAAVMVTIAYALTLSSSMIPYSKTVTDEKVFEAVVISLFGMHDEITYQEMEKWLKTHCPHMFCGVHNWVYTILTGSKMPSELETAPVPELDKFIEGKYCISMGILWLMSASLPHLYTHEKESEGQELPSNTKNPLLTSFHFLMKLARLSRCQSWTILYDSDEHGLSMNRFSHHVTSYKEPNITLVSFEGRNVYCIAQDGPWRDGSYRFGGDNTVLLQISPVYRVVQASGPLVLWNVSDRNIPTGIHVGKDGKSIVLHIPADFESVQHYGVTCKIHKVEMWGCGGHTAYHQQQKQKQWEHKEVEKARSKKLHMDANWDENPDKQLLSWGGVEVNHQYGRNGGM